MLNFHPLMPVELIKIGIAFKTRNEEELFAEIIQEELEVQVGEKISEGKTEAQLHEFDCCHTQEETAEWLRKNCPAYKEIVAQMTEQMKTELVAFREKIPGNIFSGGIPILDLDLSPRSFNTLRRAGLGTVEKVLAADLDEIRNLTASCREEISEKLWNHCSGQRRAE